MIVGLTRQSMTLDAEKKKPGQFLLAGLKALTLLLLSTGHVWKGGDVAGQSN